MIAAIVGALLLSFAPNSLGECIRHYPDIDASLRLLEAQGGTPRALVWGVIWVESACRPDLRGASGEIGLGQIIPRDQTRYPRPWFVSRPPTSELLDPLLNARTVAYELEGNARRYCRGDISCALAVYNGGTRPKQRAWAYAARVLEVASQVR